MVGPDSAVHFPLFLLKVRYVRILDTFVCSGALIWLFSLAWDAVKLTLKVGFICPFVVNDPTDLGATIVVAQALCLSIFKISPTQKTCPFTNGNKAKVSEDQPQFWSTWCQDLPTCEGLVHGESL